MYTIQFLFLAFLLKIFCSAIYYISVYLPEKNCYLRDKTVQSKSLTGELRVPWIKSIIWWQEGILIWASYAILYMLRMRTQTHKSLCKMLRFYSCKWLQNWDYSKKKLEFEKGKPKKSQTMKRKLHSIFLLKIEIRNSRTLQMIKCHIIWTLKQNILLRTI